MEQRSSQTIPKFISKRPWYVQGDDDALGHQRAEERGPVSTAWYSRGKTEGRATKYRKGACSNCGAMSHGFRDCTERPRRKGAKFSKGNIAPDEVVEEIALGFDAKRDRWNGFDARLHQQLASQAVEERTAKQPVEKEEDRDSDDSSMESSDASSEADGRATTTVRAREDTARYLKEEKEPIDSTVHQFTRESDLALESQHFAWDTKRSVEHAKTVGRVRKRKELNAALVSKYGSSSASVSKPQVEVEHEVSAHTRRPHEFQSKYALDVLEGNHRHIWGSYLFNGQWGYACCQQLERGVVCVGEAGIRAAQQLRRQQNI